MAHISVENIKKLQIDFSQWTFDDLQNAINYILDSVPNNGHFIQLNGILKKEKMIALAIKAFDTKLIIEDQLKWFVMRYCKYDSLENLMEHLDTDTISELTKFNF